MNDLSNSTKENSRMRAPKMTTSDILAEIHEDNCLKAESERELSALLERKSQHDRAFRATEKKARLSGDGLTRIIARNERTLWHYKYIREIKNFASAHCVDFFE